jgi:MoaA/NifB/PqqE/SkfB family radical SAM enzyme
MGYEKPPWPRCDRLSIEVTTLCNSSCSHCFVRARGPIRSTLPPDLVRNLVKEGYETGYRRLHLTGGEPLLWKSLIGILDYAFNLGYKAAFLNTNGTLLTPLLSRRLSNFKSLIISVSLQGLKKHHDRIRGKGSYDLTLKGIDSALNAGLPVYIFTAVGRSLIPVLPRFAEKLFTTFHDIKQLTFIQLIRVPGDVFDLSKEVLRPEDFLQLVRVISLLNLFGFKVELLNNPLAAVAAKVLRMPFVPKSPPLYRQGSIMITSDLRITLAHSAMDCLGTYESGIIPKIVKSSDYCDAMSPDISACQYCPYHEICLKEGMLKPSEWYRDMFPDVPYCQRVLSKASSYG